MHTWFKPGVHGTFAEVIPAPPTVAMLPVCVIPLPSRVEIPN